MPDRLKHITTLAKAANRPTPTDMKLLIDKAVERYRETLTFAVVETCKLGLSVGRSP